jgi:hypothetical protein
LRDEDRRLVDGNEEHVDAVVGPDRDDLGPPEEEATSEGASLRAARLWLYLVRGGHARVAWFCTTMTYRLTALRQLLAGENPVALEQHALRGPADPKWESFGRQWHEAMARLVEACGEDWEAEVVVRDEPERLLIGFAPPGRTDGSGDPGGTVVFTMLLTAGRWLVDNITWRRVRLGDERAWGFMGSGHRTTGPTSEPPTVRGS